MLELLYRFVICILGGMTGALLVQIIQAHQYERKIKKFEKRAAYIREELARSWKKYYNVTPTKSADIIKFRTPNSVEKS